MNERPTLEDIEERYYGLLGMKDEVVAKAKLYASQAKKNPKLVPEVLDKLDELSIELNIYKIELSLIKQEWDDIKFEYGIT